MFQTHKNAGNVLPLLLLALLLLAGGGYNYWRNLQAEPPRPYRSYADAELAQLISAYEGDVSRLGTSAPARSSAASASTGTLLQQRVDAFEAAQRRGEAHRSAVSELAGQEGILRELLSEKQTRSESPASVHIRRLTTI
ncbi:MAG: hypothetical protein JRH01_13455 [Deltaproteobacteria bacterium]|nr:hypothetical protein [Deltaproteobacteria bacterium]MBW2396567.1 hypothetical protein [Deltaproteobacteria bacterium]